MINTNIFNKIFYIYKDEIYLKIHFFIFNIIIKNKKNVIKKLEKDICSLKNKSSLILNDLREFIKKQKISNNIKINDVIFLDADVEISKYMAKYFPNSKIIKISFNFDIYNNTVNDFIDILSSRIIVTSSESTVFKYLFDDQIIINIWHASGAFKKFGKYSASEMYKLYSNKHQYIITSSPRIKKFYADAFDIPISNILSLGQVRTDILFDIDYIKKLKNNFFNKYPIFKNRKIYFYCPTLRENNNQMTSFSNFNIKQLSKKLNNNEIFMYKLHPAIMNIINNVIGENNSGRITNIKEMNDNIINMSNEDIIELLAVSDVILTDYSSSFMEGMLLNKPVVFTANDIDKYERGFFIDYRKDLPGEIVEGSDDKKLLNALRNASLNHINYEKFKDFHLSACDGNSAERISNFINTFL